MKLSILIPVYNERYLAGELIGRVLKVPLPEDMERELVIVDDGSSDGTRNIIKGIASENPNEIRYIEHEQNQGKGGAIRTAISHATGDFCIFQDADLEYDPNDYPQVLEPLLSGRADVVLGSRYLPGLRRNVLHFWHSLGNHGLTLLSNIFTDLDLTDMETCYKAFRTEVLKTIPIRSNGFGIEPEIVAKVAKRGLRVYEVPISYDGRSYSEGKKITWKDGVVALYTTLKYRLIDDAYDERTGQKILTSLARTHRLNRWLGDILRPYVGDRVLEIGAGLGATSLRFLPRDRYVAAEEDEVHLSILRNLALRRSDLEIARVEAPSATDYEPFKGDVDTVIAVNVLEQLTEPQAVLKNFHDVLSANGRLIVVVPQGPWLYGSLDKTMEYKKRYRKSELEQALDSAGFQVEKSIHFNKMGVPEWFLHSRILRRKRMNRVLLKLFDATVWLRRRIDWMCPWHGLSLAAIARKREN